MTVAWVKGRGFLVGAVVSFGATGMLMLVGAQQGQDLRGLAAMAAILAVWIALEVRVAWVAYRTDVEPPRRRWVALVFGLALCAVLVHGVIDQASSLFELFGG